MEKLEIKKILVSLLENVIDYENLELSQEDIEEIINRLEGFNDIDELEVETELNRYLYKMQYIN